MLVLSRLKDQKIVIGDPRNPLATITVVRLMKDRVRIGIDAPPSVQVHREEIAQIRAASAETSGDHAFVNELVDIGSGKLTISPSAVSAPALEIVGLRDAGTASAEILAAIAAGAIVQTAELVGSSGKVCGQAGEILTSGAANRQDSPGSGDAVTDSSSDSRQHPTAGSHSDSQATTSDRLDDSSLGGA